MNEVYVVIMNNEETKRNDEIESIHRTYQGALTTKQAIEKQWQDNELEFSSKEIRIATTKLYD